MAADGSHARGDRALPSAARRGGHRRRRLPRALPLQPRRAGRRDLREVDRGAARDGRRGDARSRPTASSSTSARISAPASTAGLERTTAALAQILERCDGDTWLLMENSAGTGGTIGRSLDELATLVDALDGHPRLGICLDSCHLYASGYDVTDPAAVDALVAEVDDDDRPRPRCARCTSTTARRRSARTATATRTSSRARWARAWARSSPTRRSSTSRAYLEVPGIEQQGAERGRDPEAARAARALDEAA